MLLPIKITLLVILAFGGGNRRGRIKLTINFTRVTKVTIREKTTAQDNATIQLSIFRILNFTTREVNALRVVAAAHTKMAL